MNDLLSADSLPKLQFGLELAQVEDERDRNSSLLSGWQAQFESKGRWNPNLSQNLNPGTARWDPSTLTGVLIVGLIGFPFVAF